MGGDEDLAGLPDTFRYSDAVDRMSERRFRALIHDGSVVEFSRGLYRKAEWDGDEDLTEISAKADSATLCLRSALVRHDLIDDIPAEIDVAIPRGAWTPKTLAPVRWRHFDTRTFEIGRDLLEIDGGGTIGIYNGERSIIDAFRLRHIEGRELGNEALKAWIRRGGQPSLLIEMSRSFPRTQGALRRTLEVLL